jgi:cobalamin biosynthesis protein CobD/CbiB
MEDKQRSSMQNSLFYGLITGAVLVVFSLILYLTGQYMNKTLGYLSFVLLIVGMVYGTLEYRKNSTNGFLSYGKAFKSCFLIGLIAGVITAIYTFVFAQFIYPGYINEIIEQTRESMLTSGREMTEEQIETALEYTRKFTTPVMMTVMILFMYPAFSAILALITAIFLKKEDPSLNTNV